MAGEIRDPRNNNARETRSAHFWQMVGVENKSRQEVIGVSLFLGIQVLLKMGGWTRSAIGRPMETQSARRNSRV